MDDLGRARALLEWYPTVARPLPWRRVEGLDPDDRAWRVLLSELMLQQTRVETVIPLLRAVRGAVADRGPNGG